MAKCKAGLLMLTASFCSMAVMAGTFEIFYDGFESPAVSGFVQTTPQYWKRVAGAQNYNGIWNEDTGQISTPYGSQAGGAWTQGGFQTTNISDVVQPGTTYTLTFSAGNCNSSTGDPRSDNQYTAEILGGTNVIGSVSAITTTDDLSETNIVTAVVGDSHPNLGETLGVRLRMTGGDWHSKALFDNVRLVADESDEWARSLFYGK